MEAEFVMPGFPYEVDHITLKRRKQQRIRDQVNAAAAACCSNCGYESTNNNAESSVPSELLASKRRRCSSIRFFQNDEERVKVVFPEAGSKKLSYRLDTYREQVVISVNNKPARADNLRSTLDHVPGMKERREFVMASSNGLLLLLCCDGVFYQNHSQNQYYICNPITKQWLSLPPPPRVYGKTNVYFGFIFHPCQTCFDNNHDLMRCTNCSCLVVQFPQTTQSEELLQVHVYASSESSKGEWSSVTVQTPKPFCWGTTCLSERAIVHNDCLYWRTEDAGYVVYDPYKNKIHGFINGPPQWQMCARHYEKHRLFKSRDSLWLSQYSPLSGYLRIWELKNKLKDDNASGGNLKLDDWYWSLHRVCHLSEMNGGVNWSNQRSEMKDGDVVAFHPFDPDIVFMQLKMRDKRTHFTQCDLKSKILRQAVVSRRCHRSATDVHTLIFPARSRPRSTTVGQMKVP